MKQEITRSFIDNDGKLRIFTSINYTNVEGCTCHLGHPPCNFCVDTCECESCGHRVESKEITETDFGFECEYCMSFKINSRKS